MIRKNLTELLLEAMDAALEDINGPLVGKVTKYIAPTAAEPSAVVDVQPVVQLLFDGEYEESPPLQQVPVSWPGDSNYRITWPLTAGVSYVKLLPFGLDHSKWLASGSERQAPTFRRRFSLSDVVAEPIPPWSRAHPLPANSVASDGLVIFAPKIYLGGADATKSVGLDGDAVDKHSVPPATGFAEWMASIETIANAGTGGTVTPSAASITQIGTLNAPSTVLKGK